MTAWSFYNPDTGALHSVGFAGPTGSEKDNAPAGYVPIEGRHDPLCKRVDLATGAVVDWQPPHPGDDAMRMWVWDSDIKRWIASNTSAAGAADVRAVRDQRLAACDWVVARATELGQPVPPAWAAYRRALRDVPEQAGFHEDVTWPAVPK